MASPDDPLTLPREIRESMASINAHLGAWRIGIRDVEPLGDAQGSVDIECASELVAMEATIELPDEPLSDNDAANWHGSWSAIRLRRNGLKPPSID